MCQCLFAFKFQSDSINTDAFFSVFEPLFTLNSNLILLIRPELVCKLRLAYPLNSNLILLIPVFKDTFKTTGYNTYFCRPQK